MSERYGDYLVNGALGEGGLATVVRATDVRDGTQVALKILSRDRRADVPGLRDRLLREADVLKALSHIRAVVRLIEVFRDAGTDADVLVLEYVRGETLGRRFADRSPGVRTVLEWMGHVCHAMHDIHAAGYVHRDIKPDNLLLTDASSVPLKIIDFNSAGRASGASGNLTRVQGAFPHTPAYLAPECFDGVPPDESADVYALGMTFAELLLGCHPLLPHEDDATTQSAWQRAHEDVPFPDLPGVPPALQGVLQRGDREGARRPHPERGGALGGAEGRLGCAGPSRARRRGARSLDGTSAGGGWPCRARAAHHAHHRALRGALGECREPALRRPRRDRPAPTARRRPRAARRAA